MVRKKGLRFAFIGSDTMRGKEIKRVFALKKFPLKTIEFFDPDVEEEYSKLTEFRNEPKVVHHLEPRALEGFDLVFLAADPKTNKASGRRAADLKYRALDLCETFNMQKDVPIIVSGINDHLLRRKNVPLIANPHPITIFLSHLFKTLLDSFSVARALAFVLQPVSAFEEVGIQELADQSFAFLSGARLPKKIFADQIAFNLLASTDKPKKNGLTFLEEQVASETRRVLGKQTFPFSLTVVLAPVFHTYSIMTYLELEKDMPLAALEDALRANKLFDLSTSRKSGTFSSATIAGKDKIFIGRMKKEESMPGGFWIWTVADNLTLGSALNAYEITRSLFEVC